MLQIKKILVPVDFCEESRSGLKHAVTLANESRAEVIALHVIDALSLRDNFISFLLPSRNLLLPAERPLVSLQALRSKVAVKLSNFVNRHVQPDSGIVVTQKIRMGSVSKEIATIASEENIDLVVVELRKPFPFLNLTVLKLLKMSRHLSCPVLLEPAIPRHRRTTMGWLTALRTTPAKAGTGWSVM